MPVRVTARRSRSHSTSSQTVRVRKHGRVAADPISAWRYSSALTLRPSAPLSASDRAACTGRSLCRRSQSRPQSSRSVCNEPSVRPPASTAGGNGRGRTGSAPRVVSGTDVVLSLAARERANLPTPSAIPMAAENNPANIKRAILEHRIQASLNQTESPDVCTGVV